jgi:hypothetical protein
LIGGAGNELSIYSEGFFMRGKITKINCRAGLAVVQISKDSFSVFEMMGSTVDVGQEISGNLELRGTVAVRNLSRNMDMETYVLESKCSATHAEELVQWNC